jgi:hypothetical protein
VIATSRGVRGSDFYRRYLEKFTEIAKEHESPPEWRASVEATVRQFHSESMPMARAPFRLLRDVMVADLAKTQRNRRGRDVFSLAADLIGKL